jgi:hypothetical protein
MKYCPKCKSKEITTAVFEKCYGEIDKIDNPIIFVDLALYVPWHGSEYRCKKCGCYFSIWWKEDEGNEMPKL